MAPVDPEVAETYAGMVMNLLSLAARHFNLGMRAYFFAMAAFSWLLNPVLFLVATTIVVAVVYRRDFRSRTARIVLDQVNLAATVATLDGDRRAEEGEST